MNEIRIEIGIEKLGNETNQGVNGVVYFGKLRKDDAKLGTASADGSGIRRERSRELQTYTWIDERTISDGTELRTAFEHTSD